MMNVKKIDFASTIKENMEIYAHEVNENRAIPSIYDSLKPVQRRALFGLKELKAFPSKDFAGSAEVVGYILGHYHPHGDSSVYEAIARLAQPLIMLFPLIDFHGAVGSLIDPPAAMRYTGCRLSHYGMSIIQDSEIEGVIKYKKNYNDLYDEPLYFNGPMATLNLLINPQLGIGVGLASNFTCHSPKDILAALNYRIANPSCSIDELLENIPLLPSYPKCGKIINPRNIPAIYKTGKGTVVLQAKYKWQKDYLLIQELPYRVDAGEVKKKLLRLVEEGKFSEIDEVYEERGQLKIYCNPINQDDFMTRLFKQTALQSQYHINMMATDLTGRPHLFTLLEILDTHILIQHDRLIKKATYYADKYQQEFHIQEGLVKALDDIDAIITLIKATQNTKEASLQLQAYLSIDAEQAKAILDIKLSKLTHLEVEEIKAKMAGLTVQIKSENEIISSSEVRNTLYFQEIEKIPLPLPPKTECLDLICFNNDGGKATKSFWLSSSEEQYFASYEEEEDSEMHIDAADDIIIITDEVRGFLRKSSDFVMGKVAWDSLIKLNKDEKILGVYNKETFKQSEYIEFEDSDNEKWSLHSSFVLAGASPRGKRLTVKKYKMVKSYFQEGNSLNPRLK